MTKGKSKEPIKPMSHCLKALDWNEEAIKEYNEMLELNPGDNQGIRYTLASILLFTGKYKPFSELYKKYQDEESTFGLFNYALYLFATEGATAKANKALNLANQENAHVINFHCCCNPNSISNKYAKY